MIVRTDAAFLGNHVVTVHGHHGERRHAIPQNSSEANSGNDGLKRPARTAFRVRR